MKNINSKKVLSLIAASLLISFSSCKKDKVEDPVVTDGSIMFHIHTMADTTEVDALGDTIFLSSGRMIVVDLAKMYISNIRLIKTDNSEVSLGTVKILQKQGTEEYGLGTAPAGNYKSVKFDIGLSDADNASSPASGDAILNQSSMWFGATAQPDGYVFVNFAG